MGEAVDVAIRTAIAWQHVGLLLVGLLLLAIAGVLFTWFAHVRLTGRRVRARIAAVRMTERRPHDGTAGPSGEMYYAVVEYRSNGDTLRAEVNGGSNWLLNKLPGTEIEGFVRPNDPETVQSSSLGTPMVALLLGAAGLLLLAWAFATFELTLFTAIIGLAFVIWAGAKVARQIKPRSQWDTPSSFRQRRGEKRRKERAQGRLLTDDEIRERVSALARRERRWTPVLALVGVASVGAAGYLGRGTVGLMAGSERASGRVVRFETQRRAPSGGGGTPYPVVEFTTSTGARVEFTDRFGSKPPAYRPGDAVDVLYDPSDPDAAIVDRGVWNWAAPGGCLAGGLVLLWTARRYRAAVRRARDLH